MDFWSDKIPRRLFRADGQIAVAITEGHPAIAAGEPIRFGGLTPKPPAIRTKNQ
jgi:hypothetical protein